jgi:hypothetical protein
VDQETGGSPDAQPAAGQEQKPGFIQQAWNKAAEFIEEDQKKWGGMTPGAMFRLGVAELREAASLGGNVAQPTPLGMYGTLTPGEVGAARENENGDVRRWEEEPLRKHHQRFPSPSEIVEGKSSASIHGQTPQAGKQNLPSPGEIDGGQGQQQNQGRQRGREHGQSRGRGR